MAGCRGIVASADAGGIHLILQFFRNALQHVILGLFEFSDHRRINVFLFVCHDVSSWQVCAGHTVFPAYFYEQ